MLAWLCSLGPIPARAERLEGVYAASGRDWIGANGRPEPVSVRPPPTPSLPRPIDESSLMPILGKYGRQGDSLREILRKQGDEAGLFERHLRATLPPHTPPQRALLRALRRHLPTLDPRAVFFIDGTHPFADPLGHSYTRLLFDSRGGERTYLFISDAEEPSYHTVSSIIHEHMHQKQLSRFKLAQRLEAVTGIPRKLLLGAASHLQEGPAQLLTKHHLGLILMTKGDPFAEQVRLWLIEAACRAREDDDTAGGCPRPEDVDERQLLDMLEEVAVQRNDYSWEIDSARNFPAAASSGAPDVSIAMSGNLKPLLETWSPDKRSAMRIIAEHFRAHPDPPLSIAGKLRVTIGTIIDPSDPAGADEARNLVDDMKRRIREGDAPGSELSDRLRPGGISPGAIPPPSAERQGP